MVAEVMAVELAAVQRRLGDFHRARVKLNSNQPLARFVPLAQRSGKKRF
jgi:hypothetical protein